MAHSFLWQFSVFTKHSSRHGKKKASQLLMLQLSSFQFGEAYFKNWVSEVLSFYLEQTTYLRKFLQFFVSVDIDTLGQTCPKAPCLTSFLYVFLIGILSQEGQIGAPATGAPALAVDSISSVLPLETCKTATQSLFLQAFDKWSYSDCAPNRHFFVSLLDQCQNHGFPPYFCCVLFALPFVCHNSACSKAFSDFLVYVSSYLAYFHSGVWLNQLSKVY